METILKGNGKDDWFLIIDDKVALRFKRGMSWADMMKVTNVIEDNIVDVHVNNKEEKS